MGRLIGRLAALALWAVHAAGPNDLQAREPQRPAKQAVSSVGSGPLPPRRPRELIPSRPIPADGRSATATQELSGPEGLIGPPVCYATFFEHGGSASPTTSDNGNGACAVAEPVTFRAIAMLDGTKVELDSAVTVTCPFAVALIDWVRHDLPGIVGRENGKLARLTGVGGHACRPRNGVPGARISEHATGNALDLAGLRLDDGRDLSLAGKDAATRSMREGVRTSVCARFKTVLGPGSDASHKDHLHLDMRQRPRDYKICQWTIE